MVQCNSLQKQAASQPTQPPQSTKRNAVVPVHVGLRTVLACYLPLLLSSSEEEEDDDDNNNNNDDKGEEA
jgi:hypothetical protein